MGHKGVRAALCGGVLAAVAMTGCSAGPTGEAAQSNPCEFGAAVFDVGPVGLCEDAIALAQARLGWLHWPVTSMTFRRDMCPPNARCAIVAGIDRGEGWGIFTFSIGDPSMIHISRDANGVLIPGNPESPPDWLKEELSRQGPFRPTESQGGGG
jgi:hypothetical protein